MILIGGNGDTVYARLTEVMGRPELKTDPRFATNDARVQHRDELDAIIGGFIRQRTQADALALFEAAGVTVGPVCSVADLLGHPYTEGREAIVEMQDADLGSLPMHNVIPRLEATPGALRRPAPALGEHTDEILAELARLP
jgi:crotonobetainyl-CoA:carnitine CoA-transferase CaiB-like acyl-CoA transferase